MSAVFSNDGTYRYRLARNVSLTGVGTCCFVMLNPSTANGVLDDPTVRKCMGYARGLGCERLEVVNLFAYRSTNPSVLRAMSRDNAVGPENDSQIVQACGDSRIIICAWGNHGSLFGRDREVLSLIRTYSKCAAPVALKINAKSGQPAHPLYLRGDAVPVALNP